MVVAQEEMGKRKDIRGMGNNVSLLSIENKGIQICTWGQNEGEIRGKRTLIFQGG